MNLQSVKLQRRKQKFTLVLQLHPMDVSLSELWKLVMDREAWRAVIHEVLSQTRLSD